MKAKNIIVLLLFLWPAYAMHAEGVNLSPLYFGPNALPVPDMLDGRVQSTVYAELSYDLHCGFYGDYTHTAFARINVPLFSSRVNFSAWMPVYEYYLNSEASISHQNPSVPKYRGGEFGNVYLSMDIRLLKQKEWIPDLALRVALITASGDSDEHSRYFDAPGYFFDTSIGRNIDLGGSFLRKLRFVANAGFLCWQVDKYRQNDAYMYGLKTILSTSAADLSASWQGYTGWIGNGDRPMVIKADIIFKLGNFHPIIGYEYGIRDWPFHHFRFGLGYSF